MIKMSHIKYMGIELEGAYKSLNDWQSERFKGDGSVHINDDERCLCCSGECDHDLHDHYVDDDQQGHNSDTCACCQCSCNCMECHVDDHECIDGNNTYPHIGELVSDPLRPTELLTWISDNYPDFVNRTCGAHIHISFNSLIDYAKLLEKDFYNYFLDKMIEFGRLNKIRRDSEFYKRLEGQNTYCKKQFDADRQVLGSGDRYTQINACAFDEFGTIEIRLMPCFKKKYITQNAVYFLYRIIEEYLEKNKKRNRAIKIKVSVNG